MVEGEPEYEIEHILKLRKRNGVTQYLVHWRGYGEEEDSWLNEYDMQNAQELIEEFEAHQTVQAPPRRHGRRH